MIVKYTILLSTCLITIIKHIYHKLIQFIDKKVIHR